MTGYTGKVPGDRAVAAGYGTRDVIENVSSGARNSVDSVDSLMGAIYHRFGFLDMRVDEIGLAASPLRNSPESQSYVYKMGTKSLVSLCQQKTYQGHEGYYSKLCRRDIQVKAQQWDSTKDKIRAHAPKIVIWPPSGAKRVIPVFYEESPDPLPDYSVSGYPISIEFNPYYFSEVEVTRFDLYDTDLNRKIQQTRLLDENNDPNGMFTSTQFALFPLQRLKWGRNYRAEVTYQFKGKSYRWNWTFQTQKPKFPLLTISRSNAVRYVANRKTYAVYVPPTRRIPLLKDIGIVTPPDMKASVEQIDHNTLEIRLSGQLCDTAEFKFEQGGGFRLRISANLSAKDQNAACEQHVQNSLPGEVIDGRGEKLNVRAGKSHTISVKPSTSHPEIGNISYSHPSTTKIKIEQLSPHSLKIRMNGRRGDQATFRFSGNRSFKLRIQ